MSTEKHTNSKAFYGTLLEAWVYIKPIVALVLLWFAAQKIIETYKTEHQPNSPAITARAETQENVASPEPPVTGIKLVPKILRQVPLDILHNLHWIGIALTCYAGFYLTRGERPISRILRITCTLVLVGEFAKILREGGGTPVTMANMSEVAETNAGHGAKTIICFLLLTILWIDQLTMLGSGFFMRFIDPSVEETHAYEGGKEERESDYLAALVRDGHTVRARIYALHLRQKGNHSRAALEAVILRSTPSTGLQLTPQGKVKVKPFGHN